MKKRSLPVLMGAVACGGLAAYLAAGYLQGQPVGVADVRDAGLQLAVAARDLPSGSTGGQASLGGREWRWVRVVSATDMPGVGTIVVRVFADEEQAAERVLFRAAGA